MSLRTKEVTALFDQALRGGYARSPSTDEGRDVFRPFAQYVEERWQAGEARSDDRLVKVMFAYNGTAFQVFKVYDIE